MPSAKVAYS